MPFATIACMLMPFTVSVAPGKACRPVVRRHGDRAFRGTGEPTMTAIGLELPADTTTTTPAFAALVVATALGSSLRAERRAERHVDHVHVVIDRPVDRVDHDVGRAGAAEHAHGVQIGLRRHAGSDGPAVRRDGRQVVRAAERLPVGRHARGRAVTAGRSRRRSVRSRRAPRAAVAADRSRRCGSPAGTACRSSASAPPTTSPSSQPPTRVHSAATSQSRGAPASQQQRAAEHDERHEDARAGTGASRRAARRSRAGAATTNSSDALRQAPRLVASVSPAWPRPQRPGEQSPRAPA